MKKILKWFSLFFLLVVLACGSPPVEKEPALEATDFIGQKENGIYRGIDIGLTNESFSSSLRDSVLEQSDSLVKSFFVIDKGGRVCEVVTHFSFDVYGLFEIQSDIFPPTDSVSKVITDMLQAELTLRYGEFARLGNTMRWTTNSERNNIIEISLSNESIDYGEPFVSLNYLEPLDEEV
jgi:hypothetical protein